MVTSETSLFWVGIIFFCDGHSTVLKNRYFDNSFSVSYAVAAILRQQLQTTFSKGAMPCYFLLALHFLKTVLVF